MSDDAFGPLEDAFFAAGDAYAQHKEESPGAEDEFVEIETESALRLRLATLRARLRPALSAARTRVILQARLLQLRLAVAVSTCAEQALRATAVRVIGARALGTGMHTFIPRLARNPVLVRASLFVLVFTAATFPAAAVLAATGAL